MVQINMETIMTQYENRLLDDLAKVFTSAAGAAQGVRSEVETLFRSQAERLLADLDLVSREEFEVSQDNEALAARVEALEAAIAAK
jgi:BMFP domain-containing protein YqiC